MSARNMTRFHPALIRQRDSEVGYANPPAFSTMFRNALGFPPSHLCHANGNRNVA